MARPPNADAADTRARILTAAIRHFGECGFSGVSVRTIAGDAGVSFATVHHYYGSKAELYERCLGEGLAQVGRLQAEIAGAFSLGDPEQTVRALAARAFRYAVADRETSRFLLRATLFEQSSPSHERTGAGQQAYLDLASAALGAALGRPPEGLRLPLLGMMFLLSRMAVMSEAERERVGASDEELEAYVVNVAVSTILETVDE